MTDLQLTDWDKDIEADPQEEYYALVKTLQWVEGFGLLFIRCAPSEEEDFILRVQKDVSEKRFKTLAFNSPVENFYQVVNSLPDKDDIDILFVSGLAKSIVEYNQPGFGSEGSFYSLSTVPKILSHLNLHRERFRDDFSICFVFLLPLFALKYFIRRAPDFFDWNSGVWEFHILPEKLQEQAVRLKSDRNHWEHYKNLSSRECADILIEIEELIDSPCQSDSHKANLFFEKGLVLDALEKYELAIESYEHTIDLNAQSHQAWYNRGVDLLFLGQYEESLKSFDNAISIAPDKYEAWNSRGIVLRKLGKFEEAIESYQQSIRCSPSFHEAIYNLGVTYSMLQQHEQALSSYQQVLATNPDHPEALYNSACTYAQLGQDELAIQRLRQAILLNPHKYKQIAASEPDFTRIKDYDSFQLLLEI